MPKKSKALVVTILGTIVVLLAALVWIQTKALVVTLGLLLVLLAVLYVVVRKF